MPYRKPLIMLLMVVLAGCSVFPPRPHPNFFMLDSEPNLMASKKNVNAAPAAPSAPTRLGLGPITFPEYLDRLEVVTRIDDNRIAISETDRWAAPLDGAFKRVLAQDLSTRVPNCLIASYPWYGDARPDFQISINVERFDVTMEGLVRLEASWTINDLKTHTSLHAATTALSRSAGGGNPAAAAAVLSHTVADFSSQIAFAVEQINATRLR